MKILKSIQLLICFISFLLFFSAIWFKKYFGSPRFEQTLYHLQFGGDGILTSSPELIKTYFIICIIPSILLLYLITNILFSNRIKLFRKKIISIGCVFSLLISSVCFFLSTINYWSYLSNQNNENIIDKGYAYPIGIKAPKEKHNLITIYVESLETTFRNESYFNKNLLKSLDDVTQSWQEFEFVQSGMTSWTIGGIVASQCGIPLLPYLLFDNSTEDKSIQGSNRPADGTTAFLPNAICLSDILKQSGYTNVFLNGANLLFANKGLFFTSHSYDEVWGSEEWKQNGETNFYGWGLQDDHLFVKAKQKLDILYSEHKPFNLTILTVDTHHPSGQLNTYCKEKGGQGMADIIECSANLISDFIKYIKSKNYDKDTSIVIIGDHLSMPSDLYPLITQEKNRTIYNKFYSSKSHLIAKREKILHYSIYPSILTMLGFDIPNGRAGLGSSGFIEQSNDAPDNNHRIDDFLKANSPLYQYFWQESNKNTN